MDDWKKKNPDYDFAYLIKLLSNPQNNYLIECGAFDGISGSPGYVLEKICNTKCINIEPNPYCFEKIEEVRKSSININKALGSKKSKCDLCIPSNDNIGKRFSARSSLKLDSKYWEEVESNKENVNVSVEIDTYKNIIDPMGKKIEVLILDVEGFELEVLKGMIKSNFLPNLIVAETNQIDKNEFLKEINKIQKYKIILEYRNNTFYSKNEINFLKILYANLKVKTDSVYLKRIIKSFLPKNYRKNTKRKIINFLLGKN